MTAAAEIIRREVEAALPPSHRPLAQWSPPRAREWSWHFDAVGGGTRLLVKVSRWEGVDTLERALAEGAQADTAGEFAALQAIADAVERSGDEGLAAVRPVAYVPAVNAVVLEWLEARPLSSALRRTTSPWVAGALLERTGRWLRVAQVAMGPIALEPIDVLTAPSGRDDGLAGFRSPPPGFDDAAALVAAMGRRLGGRSTPTGTTHGDFSMRNILVTGDGRVAVIDPNRYRGPVLRDPARLSGELLVGRARLVTGGLLPGAARVGRWVEHLMTGFGDHDAEVFAYERAVAVLERWRAAEGRPGVSRLAVKANRRLFRSTVSRLGA